MRVYMHTCVCACVCVCVYYFLCFISEVTTITSININIAPILCIFPIDQRMLTSECIYSPVLIFTRPVEFTPLAAHLDQDNGNGRWDTTRDGKNSAVCWAGVSGHCQGCHSVSVGGHRSEVS